MITQNGISTTTALGSEQYENFTTRVGRKTRKLVQYDYRHTDGELFSCVSGSLAVARQRRDVWLEQKLAEVAA